MANSILFLYDLSYVEKFGEVRFFIFFLEFWGLKGLFQSFAIFYSEQFSLWKENNIFS